MGRLAIAPIVQTLFIAIFLALSVLPRHALSQETPYAAPNQSDFPRRVAVYVTGGFTDHEKSVLGAYLLAALVNSGQCISHENAATFLRVANDQSRQIALDDSRISAIARNFGIKYVCVASISPAFGAPGTFTVFARMLNTETERARLNGDATGHLKTTEDLTTASNAIVEKMLGRRAPPPPPPPPTEPVVAFETTQPAPFQTQEPVPAAPENQTAMTNTAPPNAVTQAPAAYTAGFETGKTAPQPTLKKTIFRSVAVSLDALGALTFAYGLVENSKTIKLINETDYPAADKAAKRRNTAYIVGGALFASGVAIHIFF
ncbi:hypothetical protein R80B4_03306 [Fibrobacteres bacterium R8-0-B4]